ncbi:trihelix transcription factor GTL1-like isoform X1 [Populus alba x Populus x berolinensis]|nr:trihelix transcription factor GTL1-like isoform X1 [Populus alba x Populus x berolinensis]
MQQGGGERGSTQSQYAVSQQLQQQGDMPLPPSTSAALATHMQLQQQQQVVEEASPISSRPPATAATTSGGGLMNLDEFMRLSGGGGAEEDIAGEDADRTGGIASGNRWPRQETLALLQIRSEMDAAFRDATLKGPLWEDVSRKLAEMGYKRSAKKCKEKFENVHKYYKRTKDGRAGRQDGKSYRFFSQLEALQNTGGGVSASISNVSGVAPQLIGTATTSSLDVAPVSVGIPMPIRTPPPSSQVPQPASNIGSMFPPDLGATVAPTAAAGAPVGISFSSNESSSSQSSEDDDDDEDGGILGGQTSAMGAGTSRKRKRASLSSSKGETHRMMEFFEGLMKQVMQKQEAMQQRFLEAIEKREQDRMIRDEAWKRQEMARSSREHEIMAQERSISASRDAAIVAFLQKITGQTIHVPTPVSIAPPVSQPPPPTQPQQVQIAQLVTVSTQPPLQPQPMPLSQVTPQQNKQLPQQQHHQQQQHQQVHHPHQPPSISSDIVMAVPEQQIAPLELGSGGSEPASSRWPKPEVLALIKLRSGLETRYQEAGPKGPLWEEISAGMLRLGYKRSSKRCKEKWENINKYFKKVKESNKKRPEDAKTCPYFHELDALYRKKILGSSSGGAGNTSTSGFDSQNRPQKQQHQPQESLELDPMPPPMQQAVPQQTQATESQNKNGASVDVQASNTGLAGSPLGEGNEGAEKKPEDIVKELIKQQGTQQQQQQQQLMVDDYDKMEEGDSENVNEDEYDEEDDGDEDEEEDEALQEERKMAYKIEFQRQNTSNATNGGGSEAPSFLAMVQ